MLNWIIWNKAVLTLPLCIVQSTGAVEYTDCPSAGCNDPNLNESPNYDTKQSDGEVPVKAGALWNVEHLFIAIASTSTLSGNSSTW